MMEYKGYSAKIEYDDRADVFHGQVVNIQDVITFQGRSVDDLRREFAASVDDYLEFCEQQGDKPEKPYSGKFVVRIDPGLHRLVAIESSRARLSVNAWVTRVLEQSVAPKQSHPAAIAEAQRMIATYVVQSSEQVARAVLANVDKWSQYKVHGYTTRTAHPSSVTTSRIRAADIEAAFPSHSGGFADAS